MKLLHTSDWHVGRKIRGRSRSDEQRAVLGEIVTIAGEESVDITVVSGDLFDVSSPSPEDEKLVYRALVDLATISPVAVIAGNHDGANRLEAVTPLLELGRVVVASSVLRPEEGGVVRFDDIGLKLALLPFVSQRSIVKVAQIMNLDPDQHHQDYEARIRQVIAALTSEMSTDTVNVLAGHMTVYGATAGGGERESHIFGYAIPAQAFPGHLSYVALGHLHRQQNIPAASQVWYSGSLLQLDFGERADSKGVLIVEAEPARPAAVRPVPLSSGVPLIQLEGTLEQVLSRADELEGAYVRVVLDEVGRSGLNEEVREAIPGAVDVLVRASVDHRARKTIERAGRTPSELFAEYLGVVGAEDPAVLALFDEIEAGIEP